MTTPKISEKWNVHHSKRAVYLYFPFLPLPYIVPDLDNGVVYPPGVSVLLHADGDALLRHADEHVALVDEDGHPDHGHAVPDGLHHAVHAAVGEEHLGLGVSQNGLNIYRTLKGIFQNSA